jgi:poly(hydroxyalkanoate) depolymerase family esterase
MDRPSADITGGRGVPALCRRVLGRPTAILAILGAMLVATVGVWPGVAAAALPGGLTFGTGLTSGTFFNSAGTQQYVLYVPSTYKAGTPMPLVVALHGCSQDGDKFRQLTRFDQLAEAKGFIVVFPTQDKNANYLQCWDFFQQENMQRGAGEPSKLAGLTNWIQQRYTIDPHQIYLAGFSAGGAMASVLAATYPDLYAAVGIESGCEYAATAACAFSKSADPVQAGQQAHQAMGAQSRPMPFIVFQGDKDTTVPPVNADQLVQQWLTTDDMADDGALNRSVPGAPAQTIDGQVPGGQSYTESLYSNGHGVELGQYWVVHGMGHAWSGGNPAQSYADPQGPDATAAMYAFFTTHQDTQIALARSVSRGGGAPVLSSLSVPRRLPTAGAVRARRDRALRRCARLRGMDRHRCRAAARKVGPVLRFSVDRAATVRLRFGRHTGKATARTLTINAKAGRNTVAWTGRVNGRALRTGGYTVSASASAQGSTGAVQRKHTTITRR